MQNLNWGSWPSRTGIHTALPSQRSIREDLWRIQRQAKQNKAGNPHILRFFWTWKANTYSIHLWILGSWTYPRQMANNLIFIGKPTLARLGQPHSSDWVEKFQPQSKRIPPLENPPYLWLVDYIQTQDFFRTQWPSCFRSPEVSTEV